MARARGEPRVKRELLGQEETRAGRLLIRKLIAEKLWIPWNEIHLQRTSKGKPFLVNDILGIHPNFNFNVSHQGDYAVLAAEPELQVGIDIMKTNLPGSGSVPDFFRIMKRQFTEAEWRVIKSMNNEWIQLDMFYRHWALKESFIKAIGIGIGFNLQRIEFNASPLQLEVGKVYKETKMLLDGDKEEGWTFEETRLDDLHHVAVALGKPEVFVQKDSNVFSKDLTQPQFQVLTFDDLVATGVPMAPEDPAYWDNFCSKQECPARQSTHSR
ncbi:L-aminoadipate-semialdehyde dehydrogenase-phosphopantetheinyl transferase isoform X2 [Terrapene carolina triunguis]|uniref:L-aminoadipate-semialdehyde dehydrogenase-phosphopantetheinyl transferase isoform X2 n=1 Tax=Terrapene triunguis TaxID=2587831 RepID=UPI000CEF99F3|nr:L-aminoadipate-semialdehyde dehydrogenase-phosphopantetheinyl transferase isoform X2 [Terrapene carolina triunguis]